MVAQSGMGGLSQVCSRAPNESALVPSCVADIGVRVGDQRVDTGMKQLVTKSICGLGMHLCRNGCGSVRNMF